MQRSRYADLLSKLMNDSKLRGLYERNLKTLFEVHIGFRPPFIDSNELEKILRSYREDGRDLDDALMGMARVW